MPSRGHAVDADPAIARCAVLVAHAAYARKLRTVVDLRAGAGDLLALLGPAVKAWGYDPMPDNIAEASERGVDVRPGWLPEPIEWGQIAVAIDVLEQQPDPAAFVRSTADNTDVLICTSPLGQWDFAGYRELFEHAGFVVTQHQAVGSSQIVVAERLTEGTQRPVPAVEQPAPKTWTVPRYAVIPTHNRPELLTALVASLGNQCDHIVVLDNASEPPVDVEQLRKAADIPVEVIRDEEQPPHLSRFWNVMLDEVSDQAKAAGHDAYDVAVFNDDSILPAGWYDACSNGLREHKTAVIAHTTPTTPTLLTALHLDPSNRMTPHAFVVRGEAGLRADESMHWWYFDDDLSWQARLAGGVLSVPGPNVVNARANSTTVGVLAEQAQRDQATFMQKWSTS
jgi:hypothetical protein